MGATSYFIWCNGRYVMHTITLVDGSCPTDVFFTGGTYSSSEAFGGSNKFVIAEEGFTLGPSATGKDTTIPMLPQRFQTIAEYNKYINDLYGEQLVAGGANKPGEIPTEFDGSARKLPREDNGSPTPLVWQTLGPRRVFTVRVGTKTIPMCLSAAQAVMSTWHKLPEPYLEDCEIYPVKQQEGELLQGSLNKGVYEYCRYLESK